MPLVTAAVIGLVGAGVGAASTASTNRKNEKLANQSREDEIARREAAAAEADRLIGEYNDLREERPDVSIEAFLRDKVSALTNKEARKAFDEATFKDFENAQLIADEASKNNVKVFDLLLDKTSGGEAANFIKRRNEIALNTNEVDAFDRALQLRSPKIPAGTVRLDSEGRFVEGQRADREVFQTAFEVSEAQRDKQFNRLSSALGTDRDVALRQQDKAKEFLPTTSFTNFATNTANQSFAARNAFQLLDETNQFGLIQQFLGAAFNNQTAQPAFQSTTGSQALTASGLELASNALIQGGTNKNLSAKGQG